MMAGMRIIAAASCMLAAAMSPLRASAAVTDDRWQLTPLIGYSHLDNGRAGWKSAGMGVLYKASPSTHIGIDLEQLERGDLRDTSLAASVSSSPSRSWEWHAAVTSSPNAHFTALHSELVGGEWRVGRSLSLLLDYRQMHFPAGDLHQLRPGVIAWFGDSTWVTAQYTAGNAFGGTAYRSRSLRLDHVFAGRSRLTVVAVRGTDPEMDPQVPGVLLTDADLVAATWRVPLGAHVDLIAGVDHEDRQPYYTRSGVLLGFAMGF
jgi:YaiO family outer membrane protein